MKHFNSIKKNRDFQEVYQTGKSYANKLLVMYVKKTDRPETRIGISVSKKVGNSVVRHHITRLLRESFRLHEDMTETGLDIVVVARAAAKEENYHSIESAYLHLCGLHNILKKESKRSYGKENHDTVDSGLPEISFPAESKNSLHLHAYVFSIRH